MSKKRIGIAVMALGMFLWAAAAYASPEAPRLLSPPMALPVPSGFLKVLLLLTFFVHLVLVNVLLGSVILSVIDRRASASDRKGGVAFMPKVLALAVNFGVAPFLFLQVLYGHFLYPSIVLMAVWWMFVALFAMLAYYGLYVSDGAVRPARRTPILFLSALLLLMTAFLLSNASTLMLRPDFWFRWFSEPHGHLLNTSDPTLFPRYLHILLASLAVGGLTMAWRARWSKRDPEVDREEAERRFRRGLDWFFYVSLAQVPVGLLFLFTLPPGCARPFSGRRRAVHGGPDFSRIRAVHRPHPCPAGRAQACQHSSPWRHSGHGLRARHGTRRHASALQRRGVPGSHRFGDASWPDRRLVALSGSHRLGGCRPCLAGSRPFSCLEPQRKLGNPGGMTWNCPSGISSASVQG